MNPKDTVTKQEFLDSLFEKWSPEPRTETVPVEEAEGRVLAEDQYARYDLPVYRASAMDGIAVRSADFAGGMPDTSDWTIGRDFVRADTGDDFDDAYDAVIMIEQVDIKEGKGVDIHLSPDQEITAGCNVRPKGSQLARGSRVAFRGFTLNFMTISSLIRGGITEVPVIRRPRVGYIPTGSELIPAGMVPQRGQNINSNAALAESLLKKFGAVPTIYDIVEDDREKLSAALDRAIEENDIVLMSGGSSKGSEDYTWQLFEERGHMLNHWVRAVPGRPMSVALCGSTPLVNLSGPPTAALNGLLWCVNAIIARYMGKKPYRFPSEEAVLDTELNPPGFMEMLCTMVMHRDDEGILHASVTNRSLAANGIYITHTGEEKHQAGDRVQVSLLCPANEY